MPVHTGTIPRFRHRRGQHTAVGKAGFEADTFARFENTHVLATLDQHLGRRQANNSAANDQCLQCNGT